MTIVVTFPDKHVIKGENPTDVLLNFLELNESLSRSSSTYPLQRAKMLMSNRVYDYCARHVDTALKPTAFLKKIADLGVIDIDWNGWRNMVDESQVQGDGA